MKPLDPPLGAIAYRHFKLDPDASGLAWLAFDRADATTNTFSAEVLDELARVIDDLTRNPPRAMVLYSAKVNGFAAGADIEDFRRVQTTDDAREVVRRGWHTFNKLAAVPYPTLALLHGFVIGGGLEVALACHYRIAIDDPKTKLSLPEVMLGIMPGWGGMKRLPPLVGLSAAFDLMLTGKAIDARRAAKMGLVDACVPERVKMNAVRSMLTALPTPRTLPLKERLMSGVLAPLVARMATQQVAKRARREHYPAPYAIIEVTTKFDGNPLTVPAGSASIGDLFTHPTNLNLIRVYGLQERLKAFSRDSAFDAKHVHVIGAGTMGGDIAAWCALRGLTVTLQDQDAARIGPAVKRADALFAQRLRSDRLRRRDAMDRLIPDIAGHGIKRADVIIEAIVEHLPTKQALFASIEAQAKRNALLASNTSSLQLADIAATMRDPDRLIGLHFFNPVAAMQLVEVVASTRSDPARVRDAAAFARAIDKLPLPVKDSPGFLVNRVLGPYLANAIRMVDEGIAPQTLDAAAVQFGMPIGPIELADTIGLDICAAARTALAGSPAILPARLRALLDAKNFGKKSGAGFYQWKHGKAQKGAPGIIDQALIGRLIEPYLAEANKIVAGGIVADADLADAGLIFGTGFAPFRGGPLHYMAMRGG